MDSITRSDAPEPKLRVTVRTTTPARPQASHNASVEIDCNDMDAPAWPDLDDDLRVLTQEDGTSDDILDLPRISVALTLDDGS